MKLYICETTLGTTIHSTRAKAVAALKKFNDQYGVTKAEARHSSGCILKQSIKDSIKVVTIREGTSGFYDDGVKSRGYVTLSIQKDTSESFRLSKVFAKRQRRVIAMVSRVEAMSHGGRQT